jgi:putative protease
MNKKLKKPELLAPAGDWRMLVTAVKAGADAVYLGVEKFNMRANAKNFTVEELPEIVNYCHERGVDVHLTLNTIIYDDEVHELDSVIPAAKEAGVDLLICWDMSVIEKALEYDMPYCVSTQASISNLAAAKMYQRMGAKRIVFAREVTLEQIKSMREKLDIEIEAFVHGAMCVAVSGRCFLSHHIFDKSANRGECLQPCRYEYEIREKRGGQTLILGSDYVMSPEDLCTIEFIDQLIEAGIDSFKIEGRKRSPEYIAKVVETYRRAIDLYFEGKLTEEIKSEMWNELRKVYNRGFSPGFYFGRPSGEHFTTSAGSQATTKKQYIGRVLNYYGKPKVAHVLLEAGELENGDEIYIIGNATGVVETKAENIMVDEKFVEKAGKKEEVTFKCEDKVRPRDQVYKMINLETK